MAVTAHWLVGTAYTSATFTAGDLNSLPSGGAALSSTVIPNATNLDQTMDVSFAVTVGGTTTTSSYLTVYLLPLNQDGSHYGDDYASSTTLVPSAGYAVGSTGVKAVSSGTVVYGTVQFINLPPADFKLAFGNNLGVILNATAALTLKYRTYNTSFA